jgi:hypothetical protein
MKRRLIREYAGVPTAAQFPEVRNWSAVLNTATGTIYTLVNGVPVAVGSSGGASWGTISGTLSNQTDLNSALAGKSATGHGHAISDTTGLQTALDGKSATGHTHSYEPANANIQSHISSTSNPHTVTKAQVGLGSVDNTADTAKPVSTAQQTALDGKQPLATVLTNTTAAFTTAQESKLSGIAASATVGATWGSNITSQPSIVAQAEAEAGTATTERIWTAERVKQAIAALGGSGSGQSFVKAAGALDSTAVSNSNVNLFSKALTVSAGDVFWYEAHGRIHNNSGATRTYTLGIGLGGLTLACAASTTLGANTISAFSVWGTVSVRSTSNVYWTLFCTILPASTDNGAAVTSVARQAWRTSATNITGSQTALAYIVSSSTGTQNVWVHGYTLRQVGAI